MFSFYTSCKYQKTYKFSDVFNRYKMGCLGRNLFIYIPSYKWKTYSKTNIHKQHVISLITFTVNTAFTKFCVWKVCFYTGVQPPMQTFSGLRLHLTNFWITLDGPCSLVHECIILRMTSNIISTKCIFEEGGRSWRDRFYVPSIFHKYFTLCLINSDSISCSFVHKGCETLQYWKCKINRLTW